MVTIDIIQVVLLIARAAAIAMVLDLVQTHIPVGIIAGPLRFGDVHVHWIVVSTHCVLTSCYSWGNSSAQAQVLLTATWTRWLRKIVNYRTSARVSVKYLKSARVRLLCGRTDTLIGQRLP
jgi:hypothetical protein